MVKGMKDHEVQDCDFATIHRQEYKSLVQAYTCHRLWGMAGIHRIYLGAPGGWFMCILFFSSLVLVWMGFNPEGRPRNPALHHGEIDWALAWPWATAIGIWIFLKCWKCFDEINLPTMVYKANTGGSKVINPVTPTSGL
jgi:hypothetical protein